MSETTKPRPVGRPSDLPTRQVADLVPYARNSRTHSEAQVAQIAASITEFGFTNPVLIDAHDGIIAGHGRVLAARSLGLTDVPVLVLDHLTETQRRAYVIADNQLALNAGWDEDVLRAEIEALADFDLDLLGFGDDELAAILNPPSDSAADPDETPAPPAEPVTVMGDVWIMGGHRVMCGDSTSADCVSALMAGQFADICFTSPPYAQQRDYGTAKEQIADWDQLMRGVFAVLPVKPAAQVLVNLGMVHRDGEWMPYWDGWISWMREHGWRRFGWYVWDQGPGLPGDWNGRLAPSHEFIFHFNRETKRANKAAKSKMAGVVSNGGLRSQDGSVGGRTKGPSPIQAMKIPDSIFRVMRHKGGLGKSGKHPAVFPIDLVSEVLAAYAKPGQTLYEPFCGSGTQVIAAERFGAVCRGVDIDPAYVDVSVQRWENFTGRVATLEATGQTFREVSDERRLAARAA